MSGTLGLATPWARRWFTRGDIAAIEEAIPDGYQINVQAHGGRPGLYDVLAFGPDPDWNVPLLRIDRRFDPVFAVWAMTRRLSVGGWRLAEDMTVTVPLGGEA